MKKIAVILAGCGVYDGAEIIEATMSMYAIVNNGAEYQCFAPDIIQHHVINHITGTEMPESRNVLIEAARLARGEIKALESFNVDDFDAVIFPGGFGVAKNLSNFAFKGADCEVNPQIRNIVETMVTKHKPIGALCIAPAMIARILKNVHVTVGDDKNTAQAIEKMGGVHENKQHNQVCVDTKYKVVTAPCYMLKSNIVDIANDADAAVKALLSLM